MAYLWTLLFLFVFNGIIEIQCFGRVAISANLRKNIEYTKEGWHKITAWQIPTASGHMKSSASLDQGQFKAASSGLYNVYTTITFSGADIGLFKLAVLINNDESNTHPGLFSVFENAVGFRSISVFTTVRLQAENTLSVHVYSEKDTSWTLIGNSESTLGIEFVGLFSYVPGFSAYLKDVHVTDGKEWSQILRWRPYGIPGLFRSRTGFSGDIGTFVPICDGIYQMSASLRFSFGEPGTFKMGIAINGDPTGSINTHDEEQASLTFSLSLSLSLKLKRGDQITLVVKGTTSFTIESETSFSGILINEGGSVPGFSSVFFAPENGTGQTWVNIPIPKPTTTFGQYEAIEGSVSSGKFYHDVQQIFTVSALIYIEASSSSSVSITLHSDGSALNALRTGVIASKGSENPQVAYAVTGILELPANEPMFLFIRLDIQEAYKVLPGSRISVAASQQDYQALHIASSAPLSPDVSNQWKKLDNLKVEGLGSYSFTSKFKDGRYTAGVTGIYCLSANVIFEDANGPISIIISLNGDNSKRRSLYATKGNPANSEESLSVSGALHIQKGEIVAVYAMVSDDVSWLVAGESTFSVVFIGQHFAVSGFSTVLTSKLAAVESGWMKITGWLEPEISRSMFSSGSGFDNEKGNYVVPHNGLYIVSASLKIQDGSAKDSTFLLTVSKDSNPADYTDQNPIQDYIQHPFSPQSNDYYSLVVFGVLKATQGQNISAWIQAIGDSSYTISQDSTFSVVFISPDDSIYTSGFALMLDQLISQANKQATGRKNVVYWRKSRANTAPGLFSVESLLTLDETSGKIYILESGIYMVSVSISIKAQYSSDEDIVGVFEVVLNTKAGPAALITKYSKTVRETYTMKLFGILHFSTQDVISVKVGSTSTGTWENLRPYCSFSIVRIPPFPVPPSVISGLPEPNKVVTKEGFWSRITNWDVNKAQTQELSGKGFYGEDGYFEAMYSGIYFVSASLTVSSNVTDFYVWIKIGLNGDITTPGTTVVDTSHGPTHKISNCNGGCAKPVSFIMSLNVNDVVGIYIQSNASYVELAQSTSFTARYLVPMEPLPDGFSVQLKKTELVTVYGDKQITGWNVKTNSGQYAKVSTDDSIDEYAIEMTGLYLVSVNIEFVEERGVARAMPSINNIPAFSSTYHSVGDETFTVSISGVMKIDAGSVFTVTVFTESDQTYKLSELSTSSLTYIGEVGKTPGFTATRNLQELLLLPRLEWKRVVGWSISGKSFLFRSGDGFESKASYIVQESGYYICSVNLVFKSNSNTTSIMELALVHNNINNFGNGLYAKSLINERSTTTLQITGGIYLGVWDFLEVKVRSSETLIDVALEQESTFSIVKFGEDLSAVGCADSGPNIVGQLIPDNIRLERSDSIQWDCFATGRVPKYQWSKNFQDISDAIGTRLELKDLQLDDTGKYVCSATAGGVKASSNIATLTVFEPLPVFLNPTSEYTVRTAENGDARLILLDVKVKAESQETSRETMEFKLIAGDPRSQFSISPLEGSAGTILSRVKSLDREDIERYVLQVSAINPLKPSDPVVQNITVIVTDLNDNSPIFEHGIYNVTISENITVGTHIIHVSATDKDIDDNAVIRYSIVPGSAAEVFRIDNITGDIFLTHALDRERRDEYVLLIQATDGVYLKYAELYIIVADINEHKPYFLMNSYTVEVSESIASLIPIKHILAEDKDTGDNAKIVYDIIEGDPLQQFGISEKGELSARKSLDYETKPIYHLVVTLRDSGTPPLESDGNATVLITLRNTNDNRPVFSKPEYIAYIKENSKKFENGPFSVYAEDPDGGMGHISYRIQDNNPNITSIFEIASLTGLIQINQAPDFETQKFYQFSVEASDNVGDAPKVSVVNVLVRVQDVNDNRPVFEKTHHNVELVESTASNRIVYTVTATDEDSLENGHVNYRIISGDPDEQFYINPYTGAVTTQRAMDREVQTSYVLNITSFDSGSPALVSSNTFLLYVVVNDANDNAPKFDKISYSAVIREDAANGTVILAMTVRDKDYGVNSQFNVSVLEPSFRDRFSVEFVSENIYQLVLKTLLDFEERTLYQFTVSAKDLGIPSLESAVPITITVEDVNDNKPKFSKDLYSTTIIDNPAVNLPVFQMIATDLDVGPKSRLSYEIVGGNDGYAFSINPDTGIIRTRAPQNATFLPTYRLLIVAKDSYDPPLVSSVTELFIRVSHIPTIKLTDTEIGQFQIKTAISLGEFSHLEDVYRMEVLVQKYYSGEEFLNTYASEPPASWYTVFVSKSHEHNRLRRWVALEEYFPLPTFGENNKVRRSTGNSISKDHVYAVVIGNNITCAKQIEDNALVCNGPLAAGFAYRIQARIFEKGSLVPIESHFTPPLELASISPAKATLKESVVDGMLALGCSFALVFVTMVLAIIIYVCWKRTHEIVHIDHLKNNRGKLPMTDDNRFSPLHPTTSYFSPRTGRLHKFESADGNGLWPGMSMTEHNQMLQRSDGIVVPGNPERGQQMKGYNSAYNKPNFMDDDFIYDKNWSQFDRRLIDEEIDSLYASTSDIHNKLQINNSLAAQNGGRSALPTTQEDVKPAADQTRAVEESPREDDSVISSQAIFI